MLQSCNWFRLGEALDALSAANSYGARLKPRLVSILELRPFRATIPQEGFYLFIILFVVLL